MFGNMLITIAGAANPNLSCALCCSYTVTVANIVTNEANNRNMQFALQFAKII